MSVENVNDSNLQDFIEKDVAVLDCYTEWCGPCKMVAPIIDELADEIKEVSFGKIDIDANPQTAAKFGIMSIPTILFFKNGEHVDTMVGFAGKKMLKEKIEEMLE